MRTSRVRPTTRGVLRSTIVAVAVVIAAAAVSVKLLQPDQVTERRSTGPVHLPATPAGDAKAIAKAPKARKAPMETFKVFASRDPFEPLVEDSVEATDDTGTAITDDPGEPTDDTDTTAPGGGGTAPSGAEDEGAPRETRPTRTGKSDRVPVQLVAVRRGPEAVVRIDGRLHRSRMGERFAENFELLSVGDGCASLLYGDEQFTLCRGQEILK